MIDIRVLRDDPEGVKAALARRGVQESEVDAVLAADVAHRALQTRSESLRAEVKALSRLVGEARRNGDETGAEGLRARSRLLGEEERAAAAEAEAEGEKVDQALLYLPNIPAEEVPDGESDADNVEIRRWWPDKEAGAAEPLRADHQQVPHWDIGHALGLLDMERGARLSGPMFPLYRGGGVTAAARPDRARPRPPHADLRGDPSTDRRPDRDDGLHRPPPQVRRRRLPPRARRPVGDPHRRGAPPPPCTGGEILDESALPLRFTAATACYRREAGSAGRDTRGLLRVHEFDKVELFAYTTPAQALDAQAYILSCAKSLLAGRLELRYRCDGPVHGRSGRTLGPHVRPGGLLLGGRQVARGKLDELVPRYQARRAQVRYRPAGRRCAPAGPHRERIGIRLAPDLGRADRERATGGRRRAAARMPGALPRRRASPTGSLTPRVRRGSVQAQHFLGLPGVQRHAEVVALAEPAAELAQALHLGRALDSLRQWWCGPTSRRS